jgi:hypothetical protein
LALSWQPFCASFDVGRMLGSRELKANSEKTWK